MSYQRTMDGAIRGATTHKEGSRKITSPHLGFVVRLFSWIGSDSASNVAQMILTG